MYIIIIDAEQQLIARYIWTGRSLFFISFKHPGAASAKVILTIINFQTVHSIVMVNPEVDAKFSRKSY